MEDKLKEFARWCIQNNFQGYDIDGGSLHDKALELGLIRQTFYEQAVHGPNNADAVDGDIWFVLAPELRTETSDKGES